MHTVTFYTFPQQEAHFNRFWDIYTETVLIGCSQERVIQPLKPALTRRCRFCQRDATQTTFGKDAHLLPRLLGNRYILSDSECDACNALFGSYENDLANFLGVTRSLFSVQGVKKPLVFKSADRLITVRKDTLFGNVKGVSLRREELDNQAISFHPTEGRADITLQRHPYVPERVGRSLLKMALSVLPEAVMGEYERARRIVLGTAPTKWQFLYQIVVYEFPLPYRQPYPFCFIFTRKDPASSQLRHQFYLQFQNLVFTFPLPLNQQDIEAGLYQGHEAKVTSMICPPLLFREPAEGDKLNSVERLALGSQQVERGTQVVSLYYPPEALQNLAVLDLATGAPVDEAVHLEEIKGVFLAPAGSISQIPQGAAIRRQTPNS